MKGKEYPKHTILDLALIVALLTACAPVASAPLPEEAEPAPKTSPIILCHVAADGLPNAFDMIILENKGSFVDMAAQVYSGSESTKPDAQGWLNPFKGQIDLQRMSRNSTSQRRIRA